MPQVSSWPTDGLHAKLSDILPVYRTRRGAFDVPRLAIEMGLTPEAVYKWLRNDDLKTLENARAVIALAADPENVEALDRLERKHPELPDLLRFVS